MTRMDTAAAPKMAGGADSDGGLALLPQRRSARNAARIPAIADLRLSWQEQARCQGADARLFFGPEKERTRDREAREGEAKQICASCPVLRECRARPSCSACGAG